MDNLKKLTILHSNDMHGDFLAENIDENLVGGVSMLSGYINKVRSEEKNTLYCIAGDMFRGSVIDSEFLGMSTIEIMNMLSPDMVTLGNHETDYGIAHLLFIEKCARFPIVNANLHITTNNARLFNPCKVIKIDGMKILFIGILTEEVLSQTRHDGLIGSVVDISDAATEVGKICNSYNAEDIDLTVLLTHIGFEEDKKLAALLDPAWGVDIIIGGHSHTFIEEPAKVNDILIVQAGTGTDQIGRFDITVDTDTDTVAEYKWQSIAINAEHCPRDEKIEELLQSFKSKTDEKYNRIVTRFAKRLTHPERTRETELGGFFCDILTESLGIDSMLLGSGSVRTTRMGPIVSFSDLVECFPYDDPAIMFKATGAQFKRMIKFMVRDEVWEGAHCEFYQVCGKLKIVYDRKTHEFEQFDFDGAPIQDDKLYSFALQQFHFDNFDEFFSVPFKEVEKNMKRRMIATSCRDIIEEYLTSHQNLNHEIDGRLTVK